MLNVGRLLAAVSFLAFAAGAMAQSENRAGYSPKVVARCLDGITQDPSIDCAAVLASLPAPRISHDFAIGRVWAVGPGCTAPTKPEDGKCVLEADVVLIETLQLASGTTLDCKGHRLTPSAEGQSAAWGWAHYGNPFQPSVPSRPTTAVVLAGTTAGATVENCVIENFDFGVVIANSKIPNAAKPQSRNLILNNTLNNRYRGVEIIAADGNEIRGNTIRSFAGGSGGVGISHDSDDNLVKGNTYVGPSVDWIPGPIFPGGSDEFRMDWAGSFVRVLGPVFSYNFRVGNVMFVGTQSEKAFAERNTIEENDVDLPNRLGNAFIAETQSAYTTFRRNIVRRTSDGFSCVSHFAQLAKGWSRNVVVEGNTILGPADGGILTAATLDPVLKNNTITGAIFNGMFLVWPHNATITGNVIKDGAVGLFLLGFDPVFDARISGNDIFDNGLAVEAYLEGPVELSVDGVGNYWGHDSGPGWLPSDTNDPDLVTDSYPSNVRVAGGAN